MTDKERVDKEFDEKFETKYRHAKNPDATEHCHPTCNTRHSHHYHSLDQDKQREWFKSFLHTQIKEAEERGAKNALEQVRNKLNWEPIFKGESDEEIGYQKGIIAEDELIKKYIDEILDQLLINSKKDK